MRHAITVKKEKGGDLRRDCGVVASVSKPLHSPASRFDQRAVRTKESGTWLTTTVY